MRRRFLGIVVIILVVLLIVSFSTDPFTRYTTYGTLLMVPNYGGEVYSQYNPDYPKIVVKTPKWPWEEKYLKYYYLNPKDKSEDGFYWWPAGDIYLDGTIVVEDSIKGIRK